MLTGYNTDVSYEGEVFHVQTEDKGLRTPFILSLVYQKGVILAAKRTPYEKFIADGVIDEKSVSLLLEKQHKTILATIRAGKSGLLIELSKKQYEPVVAPEPTPIPEVAVTPDVVAGILVAEVQDNPVIVLPKVAARPMVTESLTQTVSYLPKKIVEIPPPLVVEEIIEKAVPLKTDGKVDHLSENWSYDLQAGVEIQVFDSPGFEAMMDQYLETASAVNSLRIELLHPSNFWAGEEVMIRFAILLASHSPANDTKVKLQILGNKIKSESFEARTDYQGLVSFKVKLPQYTAGVAAIVVNATGQSGLATELRYMILKR